MGVLMNNNAKKAIILLVAYLFFATSVIAGEAITIKGIDEKANDIKARFIDKQIKINQDYYDDIGHEIECLNENFDVGSVIWKKQRRVIMELYIDLLNMIDENTIKDYNYNDNSIAKTVSPPAETGLYPGVDPAEIKNETLRIKYLAEIRLNKEKEEEHLKQIVTRRSNELWSERTNRYIIISYIGDDNNPVTKYVHGESDKTEVLKIIETRVKNANRRNAMLEYVNKAYLVGEVDGTPFYCKKVKLYSHGILEFDGLLSGMKFRFAIFMFPDPDQDVTKIAYDIQEDRSEITQIHLIYGEGKDMKEIPIGNKYNLRLRFGEMKDNTLEGAVKMSYDKTMKFRLEGAFTADYVGPRK